MEQLAKSIVALFPEGLVESWEVFNAQNGYCQGLRMKLTTGRFAAIGLEDTTDPYWAAQRLKVAIGVG